MAVAVLLAGCTVAADEDRGTPSEDEVAASPAPEPARTVEDPTLGPAGRGGGAPSAEDGAAAGAAPRSELDYADEVPRPGRRHIVFESGDGPAARPQTLSGGAYAVTVATFGDCVFSLGLQRADGERRALPVVQGSGTAEGRLDGVPAGDWYVDGDSGPFCAWTVTLTSR